MCQSLFVNLSIQRWTRKIVFLLSWSFNSIPNPSVQCNYNVPHSTWKIWAAPGAKVLFLICWNDCNTLTYDVSLTSCKQLIAPNSLAPQKQPDLQVFTCFHFSSIPLLPSISPSISLLPLAISLSPPQVWLGLLIDLSEAWWEAELPSFAWSQEQTIGPLQPP